MLSVVRELQTLRSQVGRDASPGYKHGTGIASESSEELGSGRGEVVMGEGGVSTALGLGKGALCPDQQVLCD